MGGAVEIPVSPEPVLEASPTRLDRAFEKQRLPRDDIEARSL